MITLDNLKFVLDSIGFNKAQFGDFYTKEYNTCTVSVDFVNKKRSGRLGPLRY